MNAFADYNNPKFWEQYAVSPETPVGTPVPTITISYQRKDGKVKRYTIQVQNFAQNPSPSIIALDVSECHLKRFLVNNVIAIFSVSNQPRGEENE